MKKLKENSVKTKENSFTPISAYAVQISIYLIGTYFIFNTGITTFVWWYVIIALVLELYFTFGSCILCEHRVKPSKKTTPEFKFCRYRPFLWVPYSTGGYKSTNILHPYLILIYFPIVTGLMQSEFLALVFPSAGTFKLETILLVVILITLVVIRFKVLRGWLVFRCYECSLNDIDTKGFYNPTEDIDAGYNMKRVLIGLWALFLFIFIIMNPFSTMDIREICLSPLMVLAWPIALLTMFTLLFSDTKKWIHETVVFILLFYFMLGPGFLVFFYAYINGVELFLSLFLWIITTLLITILIYYLIKKYL